MRGIILAGGTGSRLWPVTKVSSKQLLPVYDKPMIYYPISTLMLAGIREILIITTADDQSKFVELLGNGSQFGIRIEYKIQERPEGLAQALIIGESFLNGDSCLMILGDNIFHGAGLGNQLRAQLPLDGAHIFTYTVTDPSQYGVLTVNDLGQPIFIEEKPLDSSSNLAVTGLYFFDNRASGYAKKVIPSRRGELEITAVINKYLEEKDLTFTHLTRGTAWLDTGNPTSLHDAATYVRLIEERTGLKIACLEEIAYTKGYISSEEFLLLCDQYQNSSYGLYLRKILN